VTGNDWVANVFPRITRDAPWICVSLFEFFFSWDRYYRSTRGWLFL